MSGFDMEKYLKKVDVSGSSDSLGAHTTLELSSWANNLSSSQRNPQTGHPEKWGSAAQHVDGKTSVMEKDIRGESTMAPGSSIPQPSLSSARRSVGSSTDKPPADTVLSHAASSATTCASLGGIKPAEVNIQASNGSPSKTPHKTNKSSAASPGLLRTSPGWMKGQSVLPCHKGSSPVTQKHADTSRNCERPLPRNIAAASAPLEKHVGRNVQSSVDPTSGAWNPQKQTWLMTIKALVSTIMLIIGKDCCSWNIYKIFFSASGRKGFSEPCMEETQCNFRPSTSPLTHSSPSQTSVPSADGYCVTHCFYKMNAFNVCCCLVMLLASPHFKFSSSLQMSTLFSCVCHSSFYYLVKTHHYWHLTDVFITSHYSFVTLSMLSCLPSMLSPPSSAGRLPNRHPGCDLSPQGNCSSPSLSRLTYISLNDGTVVPTPEKPKVHHEKVSCAWLGL